MSKNNKQYFLYVENHKIEVTEEMHKEYWRSVAHERYLLKKIRTTCIELDSLLDDYERNSVEFSLVEKNPTSENAHKMIMVEKLYEAIGTLSKSEKELINAIYFEGLSQTEYAKVIKKSKQSISKKHIRIIKKLKELLNF